jgi:hypothetical protein
MVQINLLEIPSSPTSFGLISLSIGFKTDDCSRVVASLCPLWPKEGGDILLSENLGGAQVPASMAYIADPSCSDDRR